MELTEKTVQAFEVLDHGAEHPQYFRGCGISGTDFETYATGAGNTPREALDDALEALACGGWRMSNELEAQAFADLGEDDHLDHDYVSDQYCARPLLAEVHYYVSVRVR